MALRSDREPQVIAYWLMSRAIASAAASLSTAGAGKSGNPCARLMAPCCMASRVISRITDSVNLSMRRLRNRGRRTVVVEGTRRGYQRRAGRCAGGSIRAELHDAVDNHAVAANPALQLDLRLETGGWPFSMARPCGSLSTACEA